MATGGVLGNGVKVGYSASSPVSWTEVPQLLELGFPELTADDIDTTVHGTSMWKRSMPGMWNQPEMTMTLLADVDEGSAGAGVAHDALWDYHQAQTTIWWRIEVPADRTQSEYTAFEFQGYVKAWNLATPIEDRQTISVTVRFDGTSFTKYNAGASAI